MMMKSDVLSGINKIKVCTHYLNSNNEKIDYLPFEDNEDLTPVYDEIDGWEKDIMKINSLEEAPVQVHNYIKYLESHLNVPIKIISVGPDRKQTFFR
jgi:adenylosuccinate synthase